jgi:hypothetical protein
MDARELELINDYKTVGEIEKGQAYTYYQLIDYCDELLDIIENLKEEHERYVEYVEECYRPNNGVWF